MFLTKLRADQIWEMPGNIQFRNFCRPFTYLKECRLKYAYIPHIVTCFSDYKEGLDADVSRTKKRYKGTLQIFLRPLIYQRNENPR
jgi:hypothetical protein